MDYSTMPAGPEMDRMVAERVMGWHEDWTLESDGSDKAWGSRVRCWFDAAGERRRYSDANSGPAWSPSTDIAAAWEAVERLSKICGNFTMGDGFFHLAYAESADHSLRDDCKPTSGVPADYDGDADLEPWSCHLHVGAMGAQPAGVYPAGWDHGSAFCCKAPTAPLAICRAALAAVAVR